MEPHNHQPLYCVKVAQLICARLEEAAVKAQQPTRVVSNRFPVAMVDEVERKLTAHVIAIVMESTIAVNLRIPSTNSEKTGFEDANGRTSTAPIVDYLSRIARFTKSTVEAMILALIHLDMYIQRTHRALSLDVVHRLYFASLVVNSKMHDEEWHSNYYYARVAGVSLEELNRLELLFLCVTEFSLIVPRKIYDAYAEVIRDIVCILCVVGEEDGNVILERSAKTAMLVASF